MQKPSVSRLNLLASVAASMGMLSGIPRSTAEIFREKRGRAPSGMKYISGVYIPGGSKCNVEPAVIRNPKVAAQVGAMHEKWLAEQFPSRVTKLEPDPTSLTSIKKATGHKRHRIRAGLVEIAAAREAEHRV